MENIEKLTIKELCDLKFKDKKLVVPFGWNEDKEPYYKNFKRIPGLFIAGATGTGKSIFIDDLILSLMYKNTSDEVKFVMFDPKKIELGEYDGIKYLLTGNSHYDLNKSHDALMFILKVLESRIETLKKNNCPSIEIYNQKMKEKWPHIFLIIDEGSKLIKMRDAKETFSRVLDCGNIIGIHLIYATNEYLKDYATDKFINKFKYRMTFDLASGEQAKYLEINKSNWLKSEGEAIIKGRSGEKYKIQAPLATDEEINECVLNNQIDRNE